MPFEPYTSYFLPLSQMRNGPKAKKKRSKRQRIAPYRNAEGCLHKKNPKHGTDHAQPDASGSTEQPTTNPHTQDNGKPRH